MSEQVYFTEEYILELAFCFTKIKFKNLTYNHIQRFFHLYNENKEWIFLKENELIQLHHQFGYNTRRVLTEKIK